MNCSLDVCGWLLVGSDNRFPFSKGISEAALQEFINFLLACLFPWSCYTGRVQPLPAMIRGQSDAFAPTQWSVVLAAGESQSEPEAAHTALAQLCQIYWPPLYTFVRSRGYAVHDAQDLTQSFFAYLIEHKLYARVDRQKGKFRSFLLASLRNLLADAHDRAQTLKRGGGQDFLPLNEEQVEKAESLFQTHNGMEESPSEDRVFERSWAETLVAGALARLEAEYQAEDKEKLFAALKIFLTGGAEPLPTYAELSIRVGALASSLRSDVARLRARYRDVLRAEVRRTVERESEVEGELRELLRVLTSR
jgi:DNA-directed RNA polymerase specialized sigma24 family protein